MGDWGLGAQHRGVHGLHNHSSGLSFLGDRSQGGNGALSLTHLSRSSPPQPRRPGGSGAAPLEPPTRSPIARTRGVHCARGTNRPAWSFRRSLAPRRRRFPSDRQSSLRPGLPGVDTSAVRRTQRALVLFLQFPRLGREVSAAGR